MTIENDLNINYYLNDVKDKETYDNFKEWFIKFVGYLMKRKFLELSDEYSDMIINVIIFPDDEEYDIDDFFGKKGFVLIFKESEVRNFYNGNKDIIILIYEKIYELMCNVNYHHMYFLDRNSLTCIKDRIATIFGEDDNYYENNVELFPELVLGRLFGITNYLDDMNTWNIEVDNKEKLLIEYKELHEKLVFLLNNNKRNYMDEDVDIDNIIISKLENYPRGILKNYWFIKCFFYKEGNKYKKKNYDEIRNYLIENDMISKLSDDLKDYFKLRELGRK